MKVLTYERQLRRSPDTGAQMLTAQVSPEILASPGNALARAGETMFEFGAEKLNYDLKKEQAAAKTESERAIVDMNAELKTVAREALKMGDPFAGERYYDAEAAKIYNNYLNNFKNNGAKEIFETDGKKNLTDNVFSFFSANDPRIPDYMKDSANNTISVKESYASNHNNSFAGRLSAVKEIISAYQRPTDDFKFASPPVKIGYTGSKDWSPKDENLVQYHRQIILNNTYLEKDKEITTVWITGIKGEDGRIYAFPGYWDGRKHDDEEVIKRKADEEGWWEIYPSDATESQHIKRVARLKSIINKDGKTLSKIKKELVVGVNQSLESEAVISNAEVATRNRESLKNIALGTVRSLMLDAEDADLMALSLGQGNIPEDDPILRLIWEQLGPNEKQEIIDKATSEGRKIEGGREQEAAETEAESEAYLKGLFKKAINSENAEEVGKIITTLRAANFFNAADLKSATEHLKRLKSPNRLDFAEKTDRSALRALHLMDIDNTLTWSSIDALVPLLTEETYNKAILMLTKERTEAISFAKEYMQKRFGYEEDMDIEDRLGLTIQTAYEISANMLADFYEANPGSTWADIITEKDRILGEMWTSFSEQLLIQFAEEVDDAKRKWGKYGFDETAALDPIAWVTQNQALPVGDANKIPLNIARTVKRRFLYYQLRGIGPYKRGAP